MPLKSPANHKGHFKERQRADRLHRRADGTTHLPSSRRGPIVPKGVETTDYDQFNNDIGFRVHKNKRNRVCVVQWHYTEDPEKRDPEYERQGRLQNPVGWDQEMELDDASKKGVKVFAEFSWRRGECDIGPFWSSTSNVILPMAPPLDWWPLYLATDPGRRACWATLFILVDQYGCWHLWKSIVQPGLHYTDAKSLVAMLLGRRHPVEHVIDASAKQQRTDSVKTLIEKMAQPPHKFDCIPIDHFGSEYVLIEELRERMKKRVDGRFGMYFWDTPGNQKAIQQFKHCVYKDDKGESLLSEDIDAVDASKYLATHLIGRAIAPKKPPEEMNDKEYRAFMTLTRRRGLEKAMASKRRHPSQDESYYGDPI